ncbi:uncharacterized protein [Anoplolepis gracilipes]|uniref:uncharacterized protein n=1 Tax=Anoplolepis gracilipes TaxID=354296 RepID=UPI003BA3BEA1
MPKSRPHSRRAAYWWTEEIASLRRSSVAAKGLLKRAQRRGDEAWKAEALSDYRSARVALSVAIRSSRTRSWDELIASLVADPWRRPYKIVTNKLRHWAPPVTETLPSGSLDRIVETLFPTKPDPRGLDWGSANTGAAEAWSRDLEITEEELRDAVRGGSRTTRPLARTASQGASGSSSWRSQTYPGGCEASSIDASRRRNSPQRGEGPSWFFSTRAHLARDEVPSLHEEQYGFREGRSTVDAVLRVRALTESAVERGRVALAVALDVSNAFNILP